MKKRKIDTRTITLMSLLIALMVVFTRFISFETQFLRISFTFIPESLMGILFGPFWTGIGSAVADTVGMLLFPKIILFSWVYIERIYFRCYLWFLLLQKGAHLETSSDGDVISHIDYSYVLNPIMAWIDVRSRYI